MANTYTKLLYHIIFSTKRREPLITDDLRDDLYSYIGGILRGNRARSWRSAGSRTTFIW